MNVTNTDNTNDCAPFLETRFYERHREHTGNDVYLIQSRTYSCVTIFFFFWSDLDAGDIQSKKKYIF